MKVYQLYPRFKQGLRYYRIYDTHGHGIFFSNQETADKVAAILEQNLPEAMTDFDKNIVPVYKDLNECEDLINDIIDGNLFNKHDH